jgi:(p)ppGpp synthase/HD superfamily hydrolase
MGILQEIIQMISMHLALDIRKLDIDTEKEVFHCNLVVRVHDADVINDLLSKLKNIRGVQRTSRVNHIETKK